MKVKTIRKIRVILGVKGLLCLASLTAIALALVAYTATVTVTPTQQLTVGATSASWTVYVNDEDEIRYLPGSGIPAGSSEPTFNENNSSTYAFRVVTDASKVCAVKIRLTSAVDNNKFSKFQITAKQWNGSAWVDETLYNATTGSYTKSYIDGLTYGDAGYVYQNVGETGYYLIKVTYSYLSDETSQVTVTFQYTPIPQDSF
jgi:hypothetical protein